MYTIRYKMEDIDAEYRIINTVYKIQKVDGPKVLEPLASVLCCRFIGGKVTVPTEYRIQNTEH